MFLRHTIPKIGRVLKNSLHGLFQLRRWKTRFPGLYISNGFKPLKTLANSFGADRLPKNRGFQQPARYGLRFVVVITGCVISWSGIAETNPHILQPGVTENCESCHIEPPKSLSKSKPFTLPKMGEYKADGVEMCAGCHEIEDSSHKVGMEMDFEPPADLPLSEDKAISCLTCHYVHGSLSSERAWASISFMDKLMNNERLHKSYLLRRNNAQGELCLTCHDTSKNEL